VQNSSRLIGSPSLIVLKKLLASAVTFASFSLATLLSSSMSVSVLEVGSGVGFGAACTIGLSENHGLPIVANPIWLRFPLME